MFISLSLSIKIIASVPHNDPTTKVQKYEYSLTTTSSDQLIYYNEHNDLHKNFKQLF